MRTLPLLLVALLACHKEGERSPPPAPVPGPQPPAPVEPEGLADTASLLVDVPGLGYFDDAQTVLVGRTVGDVERAFGGDLASLRHTLHLPMSGVHEGKPFALVRSGDHWYFVAALETPRYLKDDPRATIRGELGFFALDGGKLEVIRPVAGKPPFVDRVNDAGKALRFGELAALWDASGLVAGASRSGERVGLRGSLDTSLLGAGLAFALPQVGETDRQLAACKKGGCSALRKRADRLRDEERAIHDDAQALVERGIAAWLAGARRHGDWGELEVDSRTLADASKQLADPSPAHAKALEDLRDEIELDEQRNAAARALELLGAQDNDVTLDRGHAREPGGDLQDAVDRARREGQSLELGGGSGAGTRGSGEVRMGTGTR